MGDLEKIWERNIIAIAAIGLLSKYTTEGKQKKMAIKYIKLSEYEELKGTSLQVCNDTDVNFSILQYKAQGKLLYSHDRGIYSENAERQKRQMEAFLIKARKEAVDLAITPEASVPWDTMEKLLDGELKFPRRGKLWFLGMEGIALDDFEDTVDVWEKRSNAVIIYSKIGTENKYVNAAIYLFRTKNDKPALVIQAKTGGMRDISFANEQNDLSLGEEIFLLDLNGEAAAQNIVAGMICADIFKINVTDFCGNFHGKSPLVLHIQMNPKPYYSEMANIRNTFFSDPEIRRSQIITANWGRNTTIRQEGCPLDEKTKEEHLDSGSTVYMHLLLNHESSEFHEILRQESFIKHMGEVQKQGFEYFLTKKCEMWKIQEAIDIISYRMKKGFCMDRQDITTRKFMPYITCKSKFDSDDGLVIAQNENNCDCGEMQEVLEFFEHNCRDMKICAEKSCKECRRFYVDVLVSLFLGEEVQEEYMASGEQSKRVVQTLAQYCKDHEKKNLLKELVRELKERRMPERFGAFNQEDSFLFAIDENCARTGGNFKYNMRLKDETQGIKRLLVVYIGHMDYAEAKKRFGEIRDSVHEDMTDKILLYYLSSSGIAAYDEPYTEESIQKHNNDFCKDTESIL